MESINKLLFQLGLTEKSKIEASEILQVPISVVSKKYSESKVLMGDPLTISWEGILKKYFITFESKKENRKIYLTLNNQELFEALKEGDNAVLNYIRVHEASYNYQAPDFKNKARVGKKFMTHQPLSIESSRIPNGKYEIPEDFKSTVLEESYRKLHSK